MKVIEQSVLIVACTPNPLGLIERAGRTCYQSKCRGTPEQFVRTLIRNGHESVLEHVSVSVRFIVDRAMSHQIVRHRIASYSQESTRYCRYKDGITVVKPTWVRSVADTKLWTKAVEKAEAEYLGMLSGGRTPEEARSVLPHSTKTELVMTANLRSWRNFFRQRTAKDAHPDMRTVATKLLYDIKELIPVVFEDITPYEGEDGL